MVTDTLRKKLERLMAVRGCSLPGALDFALEEALKRHDPLRKAARAVGKPKKPVSPLRGKSPKPPAVIKHEVVLRDNGQCTFVRSDGKRCANERYLELHHQHPRSLGGEHSVSNLVTLCGAHHRDHHKQGGRASTVVKTLDERVEAKQYGSKNFRLFRNS